MENWILTITTMVLGFAAFTSSFLWIQPTVIKEHNRALILHAGLLIIFASFLAIVFPIGKVSAGNFFWVHLSMGGAGLIALLLCGLGYKWLKPGKVMSSGLFIGMQYTFFSLVYLIFVRLVSGVKPDTLLISSCISFATPYILYLLWYTYRNIPGQEFTLTQIGDHDRPVIPWAKGEESICWELTLVLENGFSVGKEVTTPVRWDMLDFIKREIIDCHRQAKEQKILPPTGSKSLWLFKKKRLFFWEVVIDPQAEGKRIKNGTSLYAYRMNEYLPEERKDKSGSKHLKKSQIVRPSGFEILKCN